METRAAVLRELDARLSVERVQLDEPKAGEVRIKLSASGLCGSDLHFITGQMPGRLPTVRGHEGAGFVESVGPGMSALTVGDRVVTRFVASCGVCAECRRGRLINCARGTAPADGTMLDGTYRIHGEDGVEIGTGSRLGTFAEHAVVSVDSCVHVPFDVDMVPAALVSCGVTTGMGAALNVAGVRPGDNVAVLGTGGVGIAAIQGALLGGAARVIAIDIDAGKLDRAASFGATHVLESTSPDLPAAVRDLTDGVGADKATIAIDDVRAEHIATTLALLGNGGTAVLVGLPDRSLDHIPYPPGRLLSEQKVVTATLGGGPDPGADALRYLDWFRAGRLPLDRFVTTTYTLDQINDAIDDLRSGRNVRGVIAFT